MIILRKHFQSRIGVLQIASSMIFAIVAFNMQSHHVALGYLYALVMTLLELIGQITGQFHETR